jgi:hypothetical protein
MQSVAASRSIGAVGASLAFQGSCRSLPAYFLALACALGSNPCGIGVESKRLASRRQCLVMRSLMVKAA